MICPACGTAIQSGARFCGVCGHRLESPAGSPSGANAAAPKAAKAPAPGGPKVSATAPGASPAAGKGKPLGGARPGPIIAPAQLASDEDLYLGMVLNNRFRVEAKLGEGGFGAVYRGVQMATNRQVALKLLHPEMTRDENLVARFRREGLVLCNLKDAHTITTYDFDQTPDGTLYIAMELLQGKSLHDIFHDQAPLAWARMFKILSEMCSSLAEAHATGIVHRDLKPENIYLESRPGNPEFVKVLDFGIAKVMRGDGSVDPHAPQLTATGQTLGTLEYMSPEQLMGKQLDGRSDVYALGVLAYEMITGRLPFPDAKGPAGLITAQLKQTPQAPSVVCPQGNIPSGVDRVILKMLEKDKNNRFPDVSAVRDAVLEVLQSGGQWGSAVQQTPVPGAGVPGAGGAFGHVGTPVPPLGRGGAPMQGAPMQGGAMQGAPMQGAPGGQPMRMPQGSPPPQAPMQMTPVPSPQAPPPMAAPPPAMALPPPAYPTPPVGAPPMMAQPMIATAASTQAALHASKSSRTWLWVIVGFLVLGAAVGAVLAFAT